MSYTRRELARLALTVIPAARLIQPSTVLGAVLQAKPNSKVKGVQIGLNVPYSLGGRNMEADLLLQNCIQLGVSGLLRETIGALVGWVMWAAVTWLIGSKLLPEPQTRTDMGELLRVIGFAYAPQLFGFFAFIPVLGGLVSTVVAFWLLAATILAVRQALDYTSTLRAAAVVLIGWLIFVVIQWVS